MSSLPDPVGKKLTNGLLDQAFENTSTSVAASQMRNALNSLADTAKDPKEKKVSCNM
jgi:UTP--glucose-1-phosphate uridylyltransferase